MRDTGELFEALGRSRFRQRCKLTKKDWQYLQRHGIEVILEHARDFISKRISEARPRNDGKQTPMRGHPVFVAQHATATCCRRCLSKWHFIPLGQALSPAQINYLLGVLRLWLVRELATGAEEVTD